jgi:hypothetical protein
LQEFSRAKIASDAWIGICDPDRVHGHRSPGPAYVQMSWRLRTALVACGVAAPLLYTAMTFFVGLLWEDYSATSQTISELSAIGAPTRRLWMMLGGAYSLLIIAFGWIVWKSAVSSPAQRVLGIVLMVHGAFGCFWPPMHQREVLAAGGGTLTDTLHIVWATVTGLLFLLEAGLGAAAFGKRFRVYSIATTAIVLACGAMTATYASRMQADLPTPWLGVWERVSSTAYMMWIAVLAISLWQIQQLTAVSGRVVPSTE